MSTEGWAIFLSMFGGALGIITVRPQNFTVEYDGSGLPQGNLTIFCQISDVDIYRISFMQIRKRHKDEMQDFPLVTMSPDLNRGYPVKEAGLANRIANISGVIKDDTPQDSFLRLEYFDASCLDEGTFTCNVILYPEAAAESEIVSGSVNVTTKTRPDQLLMLQTPAYDSFIVNQTVELRCTGQVGDPPAWFRWKWRRTNTNSSKDSEFQHLTFGVLHPEGPYPQGFCRYFRASTLYLRAYEWLDGVEIRCSPVRGVTEHVDLSDSFIFKVKDGGCIPDCWNGGKCVDNKCQCPDTHTGSFCEQPVEDEPCYTLECQGSNRGTCTGVMSSSVLLLAVLCLLFREL